MNRIDSRFKNLKVSGKKALITFITAGDPDLEATVDIALSMDKGGADVVEIGIPYSDPLADGPVIQASSIRALKGGTRISGIMDSVYRIRGKSSIPLIYTVYFNSIFKYGMERFIGEAAAVGIDGLLVPDLPMEERGDITGIANDFGIGLIPIAAHTSGKRVIEIAEGGKGFVYCIPIPGTGEDMTGDIAGYMDKVAGFTNMPRILGYDISGPDMALRFKPYCEGIIVAGAIVEKIQEAKAREDTCRDIERFVREIKSVL